MLGRLRLQLLGCMEIGDVGEVDHHAIVVAQLPLELTNCLKEGKRLDVAHGATDLGDDDVVVVVLGEALDTALDLIRDVGDHLYRLAEEVTPALPLDHVLIDAPGGDVAIAGGLDVKEALIVAQVEVRLVAIIGDEALTMLIGIERPGVDIDVGIKLLDRALQTATDQQSSERRGDDALTEGGDHPAGDEYILGVLCFHGATVTGDSQHRPIHTVSQRYHFTPKGSQGASPAVGCTAGDAEGVRGEKS